MIELFGMTIIITLSAVIAMLLGFIHKTNQQAIEERGDLLDRLMAKDFVEYKEQTQEPVKFEPVNVSEEREYWQEIEEQKI